MMLHKFPSLKLCRLCGKQKQKATDLFKDKIKGSVLNSIINKYFSKEVINISISDAYTKYVCKDCEQKICNFDEFCLMVANVQKQLMAPSLDIEFPEEMLRQLNDNNLLNKVAEQQIMKQFDKRKHVCHVCDKSFRCQAHLNRHKLIHTGLRPFVCDICNLSFNQQEIMTKHKESHEGKKRFQCANCHQSFRYKISLKSHIINFHTEVVETIIGNKIFSIQNQGLQCKECGKHFATKYKLQRHIRCHTGERPFQCNYCERSFSQTGNLKLHQIKCHQVLCSVPNNQEQVEQALDNSLEENVNLNTFQPFFMSDTDIENTLNETINITDPDSSPYDANHLFIDEDIETIIQQDLKQMECQKYDNSSTGRLSFSLKRPETPELLKDLLYG